MKKENKEQSQEAQKNRKLDGVCKSAYIKASTACKWIIQTNLKSRDFFRLDIKARSSRVVSRGDKLQIQIHKQIENETVANTHSAS